MDDDNDNQTYFIGAAKEMMEDGVICSYDDGGRRLKANKECLKEHIHNSVGESKLPAHDLSLDTTEEET